MEELSSSFLEAAASSRDQSGDNKAVPGRFCSEMDCSRKHSGFASFVLESPAAEIAANVMDAAKCNFFYDILFVKEPNTVERTVWHQDAPYWAIEGEQVINALALLIFVQQTLPASTSSSPLQHADNENRVAPLADVRAIFLLNRRAVSRVQRRLQGSIPPNRSPHAGTDTLYHYKLPRLPPIQDMITSEEQNSSRRFVEYEGRKHEVLAWELEPGDCLAAYGAARCFSERSCTERAPTRYPPLSAYARGMRCPVLTSTDLVCAAASTLTYVAALSRHAG
eukprot:3290943-Rhodomonas_salina.2